jgi:RhoGEF domain
MEYWRKRALDAERNLRILEEKLQRCHCDSQIENEQNSTIVEQEQERGNIIEMKGVTVEKEEKERETLIKMKDVELESRYFEKDAYNIVEYYVMLSSLRSNCVVDQEEELLLLQEEEEDYDSDEILLEVVDDDRWQTKRERIIGEILETERLYVRALRTALGLWCYPLKAMIGTDSQMVDDIELRTLFGNLETLLTVNDQFARDLSARVGQSTGDGKMLHECVVGDVFLEFIPMFKTYSVYAARYQEALDCLAELTARDAAFGRFVDEARKIEPQFRSLNLEGFLIKPVQRPPRLLMLLRDLRKATPDSHADARNIDMAIGKLDALVRALDESVLARRREEALVELAASFVGALPGGWQSWSELVQPSRHFLGEHRLAKIMSIGVRVTSYFVFSDIMIYGYRRPLGYVQVKGAIALETCRIRELADSSLASNCLQIVTPVKTYVVAAESAAAKRQFAMLVARQAEQLRYNRRHRFETIRDQVSLAADSFDRWGTAAHDAATASSSLESPSEDWILLSEPPTKPAPPARSTVSSQLAPDEVDRDARRNTAPPVPVPAVSQSMPALPIGVARDLDVEHVEPKPVVADDDDEQLDGDIEEGSRWHSTLTRLKSWLAPPPPQE